MNPVGERSTIDGGDYLDNNNDVVKRNVLSVNLNNGGKLPRRNMAEVGQMNL